jgi:hypothetical protein
MKDFVLFCIYKKIVCFALFFFSRDMIRLQFSYSLYTTQTFFIFFKLTIGCVGPICRKIYPIVNLKKKIVRIVSRVVQQSLFLFFQCS